MKRFRIYALLGVLGVGALMGAHGHHQRLHAPAKGTAATATVLVGASADFVIDRRPLGLGLTRSVSGRVGLVAGGQCVGFAGTSRLIIFPPGTTVTGTGRDLVITVGPAELRLGSRLRADSPMTARPWAPLQRFGLTEDAPRGCRRLLATTVDHVR